MSLNYIFLHASSVDHTSDQLVNPKLILAGFNDLSFGTELLITGLLIVILIWLYHTFFVKPGMGVKHPEKKKTIETVAGSKPVMMESGEIADEVSAVIGLALHLYKQRLNDYEKARLTISRVSKTYSPWSSKIYGLRQNPRR